MLVIGANPTDAHPVFASRMKKRLRAGATAVVPVQRLDVGGGQVWGLAAPGTVITATLGGPGGQVKGRGQGRADDQGAWRARFAPPGGPGPFFGQLAAQPGDTVTLESIAGHDLDLMTLRSPTSSAAAARPASR